MKEEFDNKSIMEGYFEECSRIGNSIISVITIKDTTHIQ